MHGEVNSSCIVDHCANNLLNVKDLLGGQGVSEIFGKGELCGLAESRVVSSMG
jgi:hypothetical protein